MGNGLSLSGIVDVNVSINPSTVYRKAFDAALILGDSTHIATATRVKEYTNTSAMLDDGFLVSDPEYMAAALYFSQKTKPYKVFVGVKGAEETVLQAATACRNANPEWYVLIPTDDLIESESDANLTALATYVEAVKPATMLALSLTKAASAVATMEAMGIIKQLQ